MVSIKFQEAIEVACHKPPREAAGTVLLPKAWFCAGAQFTDEETETQPA